MCIIIFVIYHDGQKWRKSPRFAVVSVGPFLSPSPPKQKEQGRRIKPLWWRLFRSKVGTFLIPFLTRTLKTKLNIVLNIVAVNIIPRASITLVQRKRSVHRLSRQRGCLERDSGRPLNLVRVYIFLSDCRLSHICACTIFVSITGAQLGIEHTRRETAKTKTTT